MTEKQLLGKKLLIFTAHPDDEIFGCGGIMHKCKRDGGEVYVLFLTVGVTQDFSAKGQSTMEERMAEIERVMNFLQVDGHRIAFPGNEYHLRLDHVPQKDLIHEIERGEGISLQAINPTMVLCPFPQDYNQDHRAACTALLTAVRPQPPTFKHLQRCVLHYELPPGGWTATVEPAPVNFFVELSEQDLQAKIEALKLYPSQLKNPEGPLSVHGVTVLAQMRGTHCGTQYAEAFYCKRFLC